MNLEQNCPLYNKNSGQVADKLDLGKKRTSETAYLSHFRSLAWCGKRDLNRTNVLLRLFSKPANALFYGVLERTKQNGLIQFLVSFWGNKAQISPKVMGVFR